MQVVVEGETSAPAPVKSGVPQGSVLGPLLFLVYINDMPNVVSEGTSIRLFADDCLAYKSITSAQEQATLQEDLNSLYQWTLKWGMKFNPSKCEVMHIARKSPMTKYYELCGELLQTVDSAKYLGLIVSNKLQWHKQVCAVSSKANSTLNLIARNLQDCPRETRALAYTTLVRPKLEYSASVWDPHLKEDVDALERINRRAARMVFNKRWREQGVSPTSLLRQQGWQTLEERRKNQRLTMMYRVTNELIAVPTSRLITPQRATRGHSKKFMVIPSTIDNVKFSFFHRTIPQWNALPEIAVSASSLKQFKAHLPQ